jgi:hypothetical protein
MKSRSGAEHQTHGLKRFDARPGSAGTSGRIWRPILPTPSPPLTLEFTPLAVSAL